MTVEKYHAERYKDWLLETAEGLFVIGSRYRPCACDDYRK